MVVTSEPITLVDPLDNPELLNVIDDIIAQNKDLRGATMVVLNEVQSEIGFITERMQVYIAEKLGVPVSDIHGVVTFYSFFSTTPRGKYTVKFCTGTACYVRGIDQLIDKAKQVLEIEVGETTKDGMITLETCRCVGACSQAPVIMVDDEIHGRMVANKLPKILRKYQDGQA